MMSYAFKRSAGRDFLESCGKLPSSFQNWLDHAHLLLIAKAILKSSDINSLFSATYDLQMSFIQSS